jgi:DNA-binding response OmpR family regulator
MHVLLIEPDIIQATTYSQALAKQGHTVDHALGAQSAVHLADSRRPDAVVLELQLPHHNGIDFLYEFRSYPEWLDIPILVYTFVPPTELAKAITLTQELGVVRVLYKPETDLSRLCSAVQAMVPAHT